MVTDSFARYKVDYVQLVKTSLNPEEHQNHITSYSNFAGWGRLCLLVELHQEGSAPTACAASLFLYFIVDLYSLVHTKVTS